jgi:glyoxalase family protein
VLRGFHHITALAGDPQRNLDFYTQFLGLRLVKRTVNFDDPATYHFYFGDSTETPGTILTFFPWPTAPKGQSGTGQAASATFAVPKNSLSRWIDRASAAHVPITGPETRFGEELITLQDPAGFAVELVASEAESDGPAIVRLHSATLCESAAERTCTFLSETLGFRSVGTEGNRARYEIMGAFLDVIAMPGIPRAKLSAGMVHHIAWRVADQAEQLCWREKLTRAGIRVSPVLDRQYFRSIYFREPGGVLFEIATDGPGFLIDETADELGKSLKLPPWLETIRESIERRLPNV